MKRIERLTEQEVNKFKDLLSEDNLEDHAEKILEELPSHLFGIAIDYGFNDTEVRDWLYTNGKEIGEKCVMEQKFPKCQWCKGTGTDSEMLAVGAVQGCWDCEATGLEGGKKAQQEYFSIISEEMKEVEESIDWDEVERLEKENQQ